MTWIILVFDFTVSHLQLAFYTDTAEKMEDYHTRQHSRPNKNANCQFSPYTLGARASFSPLMREHHTERRDLAPVEAANASIRLRARDAGNAFIVSNGNVVSVALQSGCGPANEHLHITMRPDTMTLKSVIQSPTRNGSGYCGGMAWIVFTLVVGVGHTTGFVEIKDGDKPGVVWSGLFEAALE
jgi:hypothetical protein